MRLELWCSDVWGVVRSSVLRLVSWEHFVWPCSIRTTFDMKKSLLSVFWCQSADKRMLMSVKYCEIVTCNMESKKLQLHRHFLKQPLKTLPQRPTMLLSAGTCVWQQVESVSQHVTLFMSVHVSTHSVCFTSWWHHYPVLQHLSVGSAEEEAASCQRWSVWVRVWVMYVCLWIWRHWGGGGRGSGKWLYHSMM